MKRFTMLMLVVTGSSCGTLFNVGDESNNQNLNGSRACGPNTCAAGEVCCNESCGICTAPGQGCTKQLCQQPPADAGSCSPVTCTLACQYGFQQGADGCDVCACKPAPADAGSCSPVTCTLACQYGFQQGADGCDICACKPAPVPVKCGSNTCAAGEECCNESCGICVPPGGGCTKQFCSPADAGTGTACGFNTCAPGTECCNASCGTCVPTGGSCTQQVCSCSPVVCTLACQYGFKRGADGCEICDCAPAPVSCGTVTCNAGLECCNASCGLCVPPGNSCTQQVCN